MKRFAAALLMLTLAGSLSLATAVGTHVEAHVRQAAGTKAEKATRKHATTAPATIPPVAAARDAHGRILRSGAAKHAFEAQTGYPHGRPGYVVDHTRALACGGPDTTSNMQWQTIAAAKAKDKTERAGCR